VAAFRDAFAKFTSHPLPLAWVGSASTLRVVAQCGLLFGWHLARSSTAPSMHCTPIDLSSRLAQRIGRLLSVRLMQSYSGCEFLFPTNFDIGFVVVPTCLCVLEPSGNGLYLLPHHPKLPPSPSHDNARCFGSRVALTAPCDPVLWHRRFGHLNMQSLHAQHTHGVPNSPALASFVKNVFCDSCLLHKATATPRNTTACAKPSCPLLNISFDLWGPVNVPSPHGLR
jgi:hypothetical protein